MSISLVKPARREGFARREIWTQLTVTHVSMGLGFDNRLESVAYAHTAADLHVRLRFQNRAGLKIVGAASDLRCTRCCVPRNEFDSLLG